MNREKPAILLSLAATVPQTYQQAIADAGGMPVGGYLPKCELPADFDGLLLGGGGDLAPSWYGEENRASYDIDSARDRIEFQIVQQALAHKRPYSRNLPRDSGSERIFGRQLDPGSGGGSQYDSR